MKVKLRLFTCKFILIVSGQTVIAETTASDWLGDYWRHSWNVTD